MHVLTVIDHPNPASFSHAAAQRFNDGAAKAGHTTEIADLNAEGFDPRWTMADVENDGHSNVPEDVLREQARLEKADAVCFVFPLFWWGMSPTMKGWVDRVWSYGWAYDELGDPDISIQRPRTGVLLIPAGAASDEMDRRGYTKSLETLWMAGTFGYFGFTNRRMELLNGSTGSQVRREELLDRAYMAGFELTPPQ